mmetsp:Transcript_3401/g.5229  ORF Transcript_3401/g.5229 Transcript_3401/m.5229 type:complete len:180 (-) Transcript_3401:208-747(-)
MANTPFSEIDIYIDMEDYSATIVIGISFLDKDQLKEYVQDSRAESLHCSCHQFHRSCRWQSRLVPYQCKPFPRAWQSTVHRGVNIDQVFDKLLFNDLSLKLKYINANTIDFLHSCIRSSLVITYHALEQRSVSLPSSRRPTQPSFWDSGSSRGYTTCPILARRSWSVIADNHRVRREGF